MFRKSPINIIAGLTLAIDLFSCGNTPGDNSNSNTTESKPAVNTSNNSTEKRPLVN
ncbi:MAG: hypothetical protein AAF378_19720 [Cyanobacteria bacterium P01_A01_bin.84]